MRTIIEVEIWSDVVCPWCYIGKRRFERAVAEVADEIEIRAVYRPYQLDPRAPIGGAQPVREAYAKKFGGPDRADQIIEQLTRTATGEGLDFRMDRALRANTLLAHRLIWVAEATGHQDAVKERLLQAYFIDGLDVGDRAVLADCAADVGLDHDRILAFLESDDGTAEVAALIHEAQDHDITAVPTYVFHIPSASGVPTATPSGASPVGWLVPGAQETDTFVQVMRRVAERAGHGGE